MVNACYQILLHLYYDDTDDAHTTGPEISRLCCDYIKPYTTHLPASLFLPVVTSLIPLRTSQIRSFSFRATSNTTALLTIEGGDNYLTDSIRSPFIREVIFFLELASSLSFYAIFKCKCKVFILKSHTNISFCFNTCCFHASCYNYELYITLFQLERKGGDNEQ